jgi:hypothetical protein
VEVTVLKSTENVNRWRGTEEEEEEESDDREGNVIRWRKNITEEKVEI